MVEFIGGACHPASRVDDPTIWTKGRNLLGGLASAFRGCFHRDRSVEFQTSPTTLRTGAASSVGHYRAENEDRCYNDCRCGVLLIADGIGGRPGGAMASRILVDTAPPVLCRAIAGHDVDAVRMTAAVREAMEAARQAMILRARRRPHYNCMGATMALAVIVDGVLYASRAGDCRVYHLRDGQIHRLTTDETFVQVLLDAGTINQQQVRTHPYRHHVLNWVGVDGLKHPIEATATQLAPGDRILLTTDGVTDVLDDEAIARVVDWRRYPQAAAEALVAEALDRDSRDNVSCVVADVVAVHEGDRAAETSPEALGMAAA